MRTPKSRLVLSAAAVTVLAVTGCSSESPTNDQTVDERLAEAKQGFDDAEFIEFTLATSDLPSDIDGLLTAKGTGTHAPAFDGEVQVQTDFDVTAPLIAVDGDVYVKLPFSPWSDIDPATYGAPDPAGLMDTESGISSLFTATDDVEVGDDTRDGSTVLTEVNGTIPSADMVAVFPSSGDADFAVTYTLTDDNDIAKIAINGPFYDGSDDVTYTIDLDLAGDSVDIEAPI